MSKNRFKITAGSDKVRGIPTRLIPDVAHALIEDAMLSEAADIAATIAESTVQPAAIVVPENDIEREIMGLAGIPYLGPTRLKALADIGIVTFEQLHKSSCEEIASGRGIGQYNARKVRDWLDNLPSAPAVVPINQRRKTVIERLTNLLRKINRYRMTLRLLIMPCHS